MIQGTINKLQGILDHFRLYNVNLFNSNEIGLLSGHGGAVLINSVLFEITGDKIYKEYWENQLDHVFKIIESEETKQFTYCSGLGGVGWLLNYLGEKGMINIDDSEVYFRDLDELLEFELDSMIERENFDILHGAMGLGLYFLKRDKHAIVSKIVKALNDKKKSNNDGYFWQRLDFHNPGQYVVDFGLAHGLTSILYFLGKCYNAKIDYSDCEKLINGLISFLFANIQQGQEARSFFPTIIDSNKIMNLKKELHISRMAWCYGDLTIFHTLLLIMGWLNLKSLEEQVINLLLISTLRRSSLQTGIIDAGFCHGSSGVAFVWSSIYNITAMKEFEETSNFWIEKTVALGNKDSGASGFLFQNDQNRWEAVPGLLTGLGGVGLVLVNYCYGRKYDGWRECLFLA